jgi:hypothetical protein
MAAIRNFIMTLAVGLAMVAFVPVRGSAQSTSNPPTNSAPNPSTNPGATGQPPSSGVGSAGTQTNGPNGQANSPSSTTAPGNQAAQPNGTATNPAPPDQNPVGTAGQTTTRTVRTGNSHSGLIAFIVIVAIIVIAFLIFGANRRTNVPGDRVR